jgi:hypothetical protein
MSTVNHRGWTFLNEDEAPDPESPRGKAVSARATALMDEWSRIHHDEEQEGFRRQAAHEDGDDWGYDPRNCECDEGRAEDGDELCVHDRKAWDEVLEAEKVSAEGVRLRKELIEAELAGLGARKMRPYEAHNEDEGYYQYMEEGRFGHGSE